MPLHSSQGPGEIHIAHQWEYANAAAREAATGFVSGDVYKLAFQTDNNTFWVLLTTAPTWAQVNPTDPDNVPSVKLNCLKATSGTLTPGTAVRFVSVNGSGIALVEAAKADSESTMPCVGILEDEVTDSVMGQGCYLGPISGIDTSSFSAGDLLYVSPTTAGALTNVRPTGSDIVQIFALCMVSHATLGVIAATASTEHNLKNLADGKIWVGDSGGGEPTTTDWVHASRHHSDGDDALSHQNLSGAGSNTHAQVDTHIASTANPHTVTKTQVSLGNVTNDSQLKRAAGDFATFSEKTSPVDADLFLIEDSADSNNKKKAQLSNLLSVYGTYAESAVSEGVSSSTSNNYQTKVTLNTSSLPAGDYEITWYCEVANSSSGQATYVKVVVDGTEASEVAPENKYGDIPVGVSGHYFYTISTPGSITITLQYHRYSFGTAQIRRARLFNKRIG